MLSLVIFVLVVIPMIIGAYISAKLYTGSRVATWLSGAIGCLVLILWGLYETAHAIGPGSSPRGFSFFVMAVIAACALIGWTIGMILGLAFSQK